MSFFVKLHTSKKMSVGGPHKYKIGEYTHITHILTPYSTTKKTMTLFFGYCITHIQKVGKFEKPAAIKLKPFPWKKDR